MELRPFVDALASKAPVPGGGGASALVAALGTALGEMVGNLTAGKKKYADVEEGIRSLMERSRKLREELMDCIERDAVAFEPLSRAYAIPKDDPTRDAVMEECLRTAASVPMEILEKSCEAIALLEEYAEKGSTLAISDAGTGVVFCWAAMYGAALNVRVNTKYMKDRTYAEELDRRVEELMNSYWTRADAVYENVYGRLKG